MTARFWYAANSVISAVAFVLFSHRLASTPLAFDDPPQVPLWAFAAGVAAATTVLSGTKALEQE